MQVLQVSSEAALLAKVGGLGDVVTGLSRELLRQHVDTVLLLPRYGCIDFSHLESTGKKEKFETFFDGRTHEGIVEFFRLQGFLPVVLLDTVDGTWSKREAIYGTSDETSSFIAFSKACSDWLQQTTHRFDLLHLHDWECGFLSALITYGWRSSHKAPKTMLSLHNLEYQGKCAHHQLSEGWTDIFKAVPKGMFDDPWDNCANLLKGGILSSDLLTTVSKTYAREIVTPEGGKGLDKVLSMRESDLFGIVNGIDTDYWNPETDRFLNRHYSSHDSIEEILDAKKAIKQKLFSDLEIDRSLVEVPLISSVTRLVHHKGLFMLHELFSHLKEHDAAGLILGTVYDSDTRDKFKSLDSKLIEEQRGRVLLKSEEALAHRIFAASDIFVVPSLCEPCGLTQLLALRYGTIPVVRKTGGLADTIFDYQHHLPQGSGNGFVFERADPQAAMEALTRAVTLYKKAPKSWNHLVKAGMESDFSWSKPAQAYISLYHRVVS